MLHCYDMTHFVGAIPKRSSCRSTYGICRGGVVKTEQGGRQTIRIRTRSKIGHKKSFSIRDIVQNPECEHVSFSSASSLDFAILGFANMFLKD